MKPEPTSIITLWAKKNHGKRFFAKPDYPFIPEVRKHPEYWARQGWKISDTERAVRRIKP
jgi:hypothetical protein